jgi:GNAT superfamily N-acetyltransferase
MWQIRTADPVSDSALILRLANLTATEPVTEAHLMARAEQAGEQGLWHQCLALSAGVEALGWGWLFRRPDMGDLALLGIVVAPGARSRGIGSALLSRLESTARQHGICQLETTVREVDTDGRRFAEHQGYQVRHHLFESVLDLTRVDLRRYADTVHQVEASGLCLALFPYDPSEAEARALYDLLDVTNRENPLWDGRPPVPFDIWRTYAFGPTSPSRFIVAIADGRLVGVTWVKWNPQTGEVFTNYTGVLQAYRGRGLALALKLRSVEVARGWGASLMRTRNHAANAPMLAVNRKLGYQAVPGEFVMRKRL